MRKRKYSALSQRHPESFITILDEFHTTLNGETTDQQDMFDGPLPEIHNLVGTCMLQSSSLPLDLCKIAYVLPNSAYDKQKFAAITLRLWCPACTVLLFTSGKMVLTGSKTYMDCRLAAKHVCALLQNAFPAIVFQLAEIHIQNIVGNVNLCLSENQTVDLHALNADFDVVCTYQKNMFPGLIFRPISSRIVLLIFTSGKVVLTGAKCTRDLTVEWKKLWGLVKKYIKTA